jgi:putative endonuclease
MAQYYVYIMTNRSGTLYTGVTNDLERRVCEHKEKMVDGFTKKYNVTKLVYYEATDDVRSAIAWEKQIKGWLRNKKITLVESTNPQWRDLSEDWEAPPQTLRCAQSDRVGMQGDRWGTG